MSSNNDKNNIENNNSNNDKVTKKSTPKFSEDGEGMMMVEIDGRKIPAKPPRPFTTYHVFFQLERNFILQSNGSLTEFPTEIDENASSRPLKYQNIILPKNWFDVSTRSKRKRKNHKIHRVISFLDLTKTISKNWREADEETKAYCKSIADQQLRAYKLELAHYAQLYGQEALDLQKKTRKRRSKNDGPETDEDPSDDEGHRHHVVNDNEQDEMEEDEEDKKPPGKKDEVKDVNNNDGAQDMDEDKGDNSFNMEENEDDNNSDKDEKISAYEHNENNQSALAFFRSSAPVSIVVAASDSLSAGVNANNNNSSSNNNNNTDESGSNNSIRRSMDPRSLPIHDHSAAVLQLMGATRSVTHRHEPRTDNFESIRPDPSGNFDNAPLARQETMNPPREPYAGPPFVDVPPREEQEQADVADDIPFNNAGSEGGSPPSAYPLDNEVQAFLSRIVREHDLSGLSASVDDSNETLSKNSPSKSRSNSSPSDTTRNSSRYYYQQQQQHESSDSAPEVLPQQESSPEAGVRVGEEKEEEPTYSSSESNKFSEGMSRRSSSIESRDSSRMTENVTSTSEDGKDSSS